jgi:GH24 family phage-related lysozyme (muramidase)
MSLSSKGLALLQDYEKFKGYLYSNDGGGHCTIGWGHLVHKGECDGRENEKVFLKGISLTKGDDFLKKDTAKAEKAVNLQVAALGATLTQNQFDALVSFTYNVGTGNLEKLLRGSKGKDGKLDLKKVALRMKLYDKSNGEIVPGLTRRRRAEAELFDEESESLPPQPGIRLKLT